jgi:CRP-like cAMP-binding protein
MSASTSHLRASDDSALSQVRIEFSTDWPQVALRLAAATPEPATPALALAAEDTPWAIAHNGRDLSVTVGPVGLTASEISAALETMRRVHASTGLGSADGQAATRSVRLLVPRPLSDDACEPLRQALCPPLDHLAGPRALTMFDVHLEEGQPVFRLGEPMLASVAEHVLPLLACVGAAVALEAPDGSLPPGGLRQLLATAKTLLAGVLPRRVLDLLGGAPNGTPVRSASTTGVPDEIVTDAPEFGPLQLMCARANGRPADEAEHAGSGCTDSLGLIDSTLSDEEDALWLLFRLDDDEQLDATADRRVSLSAWFMPGPDSPLPRAVPVPSLTDVAVSPHSVGEPRHPRPLLHRTDFQLGAPNAYVARVTPRRQLLPASAAGSWAWDDGDPLLHSATPDGSDPFTFAHLFKQRLKVELTLTVGDELAARKATELDVFDIDRFGSLYERLVTRLIRMDTQAQVRREGVSRVYEAYHPWYPVLSIGLHKARLYLRAVREDICWQRRNLAEPCWLMRVGLYLEFLTCLGIIEAVKDEYPDLLSADERRCFAESAAFQEIRERIDPGAWREAWGLRDIVFARNPLTAAGPVDFRNLVHKENAILTFLEAHHADLKHAIELAGPNLLTSQQTWHRVFRDAERAVLEAPQEVFPEFRHLGANYRNFVLWHERGKFPAATMGILPPWLTAIFGDRDGVYPSASRRYRDSMNEVATWAMQRSLMSYDGAECVPISASLIESQLHGDDERFAALQALDGHAVPLKATRKKLIGAATDDVEAAVSLLRAIEIFAPLSVSELWRLGHSVQHRHYAAGESLVCQGDPTSGLYVIERGLVEVLVRQADGTDLVVNRIGVGDVFGEFSLLTGQPVSATVRAVGDVEAKLIPQSALQPIIQARPELTVELSVVLAERRISRQARSEAYLFGSGGPADAGTVSRLVTRMRDFLLT